jgi:hypothetical protein
MMIDLYLKTKSETFIRSFIITRIIPVVIASGMFACSDPNDTEPSVNFLKIYDDSRFNASYIPIDIIQTEDQGFLILSGTRLESSDFIGVYILKVDKDGNFLNDIVFPETVVHPVADWMLMDNTYYFFAMDAVDLSVKLYGISQGGNLLDPVNVNATYPLHASVEGNNFLLLSYDNNGKSTILSLISPDGSSQGSKGFSIGPGEGIEEPIIDHFTRTGKQFPFLTGSSGAGLYYFNGFYNYTFSLPCHILLLILRESAPLQILTETLHWNGSPMRMLQ